MVNNKLNRVWNEVIMAYLELSRYLCRRNEVNSKTLARLPAKIRTGIEVTIFTLQATHSGQTSVE
jgi:hypothetical protein